MASSNITRITAKELARILLSETATSASADLSKTTPTTAVVDVRDDDHIGGHIKGSIHVPSTTLGLEISNLVRQLKDKELVVFHCALSQQRGPSAALKYIRERENLIGVQVPKSLTQETELSERSREQKVFILDKGFVGWQQEYGEDTRLTSGFRKDLWSSYMY